MRQILRLDFGNTTFQRTLQKLKPDTRREATRLIAELIYVDIDNAPAKLHLHALKGKTVKSALDPSKNVPVYTIHITSNDSYKASFTYENETAYFRVCGTHDEIDKNP